MIDLIKNVLISITCVTIFCTIILHLIGDDNPQKEIVKIACGCLMIIALFNPFYNVFDSEMPSFSDYYAQYNMVEVDINDEMMSYTISTVEIELENHIFNNYNIHCDISIDENYNILTVFVYENENINKISQILGISMDKIEYIESR